MEWKKRGDAYIGLLELCAVVLLLGTFSEQLRDAVATIFIDSDGVLCGLLKGSLGAPDANWAVGRVWMTLAKLGAQVELGRVESKANISDGPTRGRLRALPPGSAHVQPSWPPWMKRWWLAPFLED